MNLICTEKKVNGNVKSDLPHSSMPQHMPGSTHMHTHLNKHPQAVTPLESRVRCSQVSLPALNLDRLRMAKALVDKAVKEKKVFSIEGPYPVVRAALRARGWVERQLPRSSPWGNRHGDPAAEGMDGADSSDDDGTDKGQDGDRDDDAYDMHAIMSRMVRNETTYLYWTTRKDAVDYQSLKKDQMTNHYAKAGSFTTKVGLCMSLRNLQWFDSTDPDTFFPRCYRLGAEDEKHAFTEDFRRTACTSLLSYVVERTGGDRKEDICNRKQMQGVDKSHKLQSNERLGAEVIDTALRVCQEYLNSQEHSDIDMLSDSPPSLSEQQWADFIQSYYLVIHDGVIIEGCTEYAERCRSMLARMQKVCPQLGTDGLSNIWIIKPGALSRGRGIVCMNRLDEVLRLVDSDPALIKDSKWVVQKYLERPLLVHGTKFDLRQWFLVTDWNPLTVWFYDECYLRFSTQPFSTIRLDSSVHLCNNSIQKHVQPCVGRDPSLPAESMWSCTDFRSWLAASGRSRLWEEVVLPGMRRAVIQMLLTVQDSVEPRRASFELYGADFILGRDLHPWLLEVNASPTMAPSTAVTARLCPAVQEDTLRVVLDRRHDRNAHTGGFQLIYKQAAVDVPQYVGVNLLVEGAQIRRPRPSPCKTFIHSHSEALRRSRPALRTSGHLSGKENQTDEVKRVWPSVSSRKVTMERSPTFQPLLDKRRRRLDLPSSSCPLPHLPDRHHTSYTRLHTCYEQAYARIKKIHRHPLSLNYVRPSLEIVSVRPVLKYSQGTHTQTAHNHIINQL
ncbi:tubulin monoglycylase TTLL3 [Salminus brasiliensis]|uniref:tubulin monoglycylase TTLL3 n=1 Tax=Salminus brasiliensis TaxID=930266 RepID=UPI003B834770